MKTKISVTLALLFAAAAFSRPGYDNHRGYDDRDRPARCGSNWKHERWERERFERERCERERIEREQREQMRLEAMRIEQERIRIALERERIYREAERDRCRRDRREAMREDDRPSRTIHTETEREERPRVSIGVVWHQVFR